MQAIDSDKEEREADDRGVAIGAYNRDHDGARMGVPLQCVRSECLPGRINLNNALAHEPLSVRCKGWCAGRRLQHIARVLQPEGQRLHALVLPFSSRCCRSANRVASASA